MFVYLSNLFRVMVFKQDFILYLAWVNVTVHLTFAENIHVQLFRVFLFSSVFFGEYLIHMIIERMYVWRSEFNFFSTVKKNSVFWCMCMNVDYVNLASFGYAYKVLMQGLKSSKHLTHVDTNQSMIKAIRIKEINSTANSTYWGRCRCPLWRESNFPRPWGK